MSKSTEDMTNAELTDRYNELAKQAGRDPIGKWKGKKDVLAGRIGALEEELSAATSEEPTVEQPPESTEEPTDGDAEPEATGNGSEAAKPSRTIRVAALEHLSAVTHHEDRTKKPSEDNVVGKDHPQARSVGLPYDEIIRRIQEEFPDCETTPACLRWYAVKVRNPDAEDELYGQYKLPQRRPRAKPSKQD